MNRHAFIIGAIVSMAVYFALHTAIAGATPCVTSTPQHRTYVDPPADTTGTDITALRVDLDAACHLTLTYDVMSRSQGDTYGFYLDADSDARTGRAYGIPTGSRVGRAFIGIDAAAEIATRTTTFDLNAVPLTTSGHAITILGDVYGHTVPGALYLDLLDARHFIPEFTSPAPPTTGETHAEAHARPHRHRTLCRRTGGRRRGHCQRHV